MHNDRLVGRRHVASALLFGLSLIALGSTDSAAAEPSDEADAGRKPSYHADIVPLVNRHCLDCHDADQADGGFRVDTYRNLLKGGDEAGPTVVPGKADESPLVEYLTGKRTPRMPKQRKALADDEIALIRAWIDQGATEGQPLRYDALSEEQLVFFETSVRPLLAEHCLECHGTNKANGNLAFLSREDLIRGGTQGPTIVPGKPEQNLLISAVRHAGKLRMPKSWPRLDEASIELFEKWIAMDAPWPATDLADPPKIRTKFVVYDSDRQHWAFQPVVRPELPAVSNSAWPSDDLDHFVLARLEATQLTPSPPASLQTLLRRLSFDLTGLPPSPKDLAVFNAQPQAPALFVRQSRISRRLRLGVKRSAGCCGIRR